MLGVPVKGASTPRGVVGALPGAGQREKVAAAFGKETNNSEFRKNYKPRRKTAEDAELRHRFAEADQNGDGSIDAIELTDALKAIGKYESEQQVSELIKTMDSSGDGKVQLRELIAFLDHPYLKPKKMTADEMEANDLHVAFTDGRVRAEAGGKVTMAGVEELLAREFGIETGAGCFEELRHLDKDKEIQIDDVRIGPSASYRLS